MIAKNDKGSEMLWQRSKDKKSLRKYVAIVRLLPSDRV